MAALHGHGSGRSPARHRRRDDHRARREGSGLRRRLYGPRHELSGSLQCRFDGGASIISNSWAYCEDQTTPRRTRQASIRSFKAPPPRISASLTAPAKRAPLVWTAGPIPLRGSGRFAQRDRGRRQFADPRPAGIDQSETWWNGSNATPPTGQGGYGLSKFFTAPTLPEWPQSSKMRSVPDVVSNADPSKVWSSARRPTAHVPAGLSYGGTSVAAPLWAAFRGASQRLAGQESRLSQSASLSARQYRCILQSDVNGQ